MAYGDSDRNDVAMLMFDIETKSGLFWIPVDWILSFILLCMETNSRYLRDVVLLGSESGARVKIRHFSHCHPLTMEVKEHDDDNALIILIAVFVWHR